MSAVVSPPHDSVSHIVHAAAVIATAASTALPPFWNVIAPAVAASGLPVTAIQCDPWSGGFCVRICARAVFERTRTKTRTTGKRRKVIQLLRLRREV